MSMTVELKALTEPSNPIVVANARHSTGRWSSEQLALITTIAQALAELVASDFGTPGTAEVSVTDDDGYTVFAYVANCNTRSVEVSYALAEVGPRSVVWPRDDTQPPPRRGAMPDPITTFTDRYSAEIALVDHHCPAGAQLDCLGGTSLAIVGILPCGLRVEVSNALLDHDGDDDRFVSVLHDPDGDQLAWIEDGPLRDQLAVVAAITTEQADILRQHNAANPGRSVVLTTRAPDIEQH
ncbi:hypothetical protein [Nocardia sp. NPDC060249]|uniref:hypothetical protein n=1 Tax=Nocardia sp. NPDC060249 TaxID=3347082 RepID=UPI003656FAD1